MDLLKAGPSEAVLDPDLLRVLKKLADDLGSRLAALNALRAYLEGPDTSGPVQKALDALGLGKDDLRQRFAKYQDLLHLVLGPLGDLGQRPPVEIPLQTQGKADLSPAAGAKVALEGAADLRAFVEADADGDACDGRIRFTPGQQVVIRAGLEGKLAGSLDAARNLGTTAASGGFQAGGRFRLDNFFLHDRSEPVLTALLEDLTDFTLPGAIPAGTALRARLGAGGGRVPTQLVHLQAEGEVALEGRLQWSQSAVQVGNLAAGGLELQDAVTVRTGLQAAVSFRHQLSGTFDILVSAAPDPARLRVELHKSRASESRLGVEVGATAEVRGLDTAAKAVLDALVPKIDGFLAAAEGKAGALPDVRALFAATLDKEIEKLLKGQAFVADAERLLRTVGKDVDLTAKLQEIAREAAVDLSADLFKKLDANLPKLRAALAELIRKYRGALAKLQQTLKLAANVKVGIAVAHERQRSRGRSAFLVFEIDPTAHPGTFRKMLLGSFEEALRLSRDGDAGIRLINGLLVDSGGLQVTSSLNVTAAGLALNHASVLKQEWGTAVSLQGDVTLSATSSLSGSLTVFGRTRTLTFLADGRVVGRIGRAPGPSGITGMTAAHDASLELTEEIPVKAQRLSDLEKTLAQIGVLPAATSLASQLVTLSGDPSPSGRVAVTALLPLGPDELDRIAAADPRQARLAFARALDDFILEAELATLDSADGTPLVVWPTVDAFCREVKADASNLNRQFVPRDSQGREVRFSQTLRTLLFHHWEYVEAFTETLRQLRALRGGFQSLSADEALRLLRRRQRELLAASAPLVRGEVLSSRINYVFFKALFELARPAGGALEALAVLEYQGKKYVLG